MTVIRIEGISCPECQHENLLYDVEEQSPNEIKVDCSICNRKFRITIEEIL